MDLYAFTNTMPLQSPITIPLPFLLEKSKLKERKRQADQE